MSSYTSVTFRILLSIMTMMIWRFFILSFIGCLLSEIPSSNETKQIGQYAWWESRLERPGSYKGWIHLRLASSRKELRNTGMILISTINDLFKYLCYIFVYMGLLFLQLPTWSGLGNGPFYRNSQACSVALFMCLQWAYHPLAAILEQPHCLISFIQYSICTYLVM